MPPGYLGLSTVDFTRPGLWQELFAGALTLTDHLATMLENPVWSFGGGTVLMLRLNHRQSKDIDLFVPDPQYLGHLSPRLADVAEGLTHNYVEAADYLKLYLHQGEIDVVVGMPLTDNPWELVPYLGRQIRVETSAEIIAKKMHYRGHLAKARDLFDLCAVAQKEPQALAAAQPFMARHAAAFLDRLESNQVAVAQDFEQIDRLAFDASFDECLAKAKELLGPLSGGSSPMSS